MKPIERIRIERPLILFLMILLASACSGRRTPTTEPAVKRYTETGIASWYGKPFHGKRTASGERFDMHALTAAHRTLAFGSIVQVTDLGTGESVKVRITDRGPFHDGRIIDLSYGAAKALNLVRRGVARVKITVIDTAHG